MTAVARTPDAALGSAWLAARRIGAISAAVAIYLCLVGIVPVFNARPLIDGLISLGQTALLLTSLGAGYLAARRARGGRSSTVLAGGLAGGLVGLALAGLVVIGSVIPLRAVFLNASDDPYKVLTLGVGGPGAWLPGAWVPVVVMTILGTLAGYVVTLPPRLQGALGRGLMALVLVGLFASLIRTPMIAAGVGEIARFLFAQDGLTLEGAIITLGLVIGSQLLDQRYRFRQTIAQIPREQRRRLTLPAAVGIAFLVIVLPQTLGPFFAQVIAMVTLYILMGFGLNITLGLAGLLDLGFVAFFAVGAYTVGLLTSTAEFGIAQWSF